MSEYSQLSHDTSPRTSRDRPAMSLHPGTHSNPVQLSEDRTRTSPASGVPTRPNHESVPSSAASDRIRTSVQQNPDHLTLRALVATKEAGIIIGKGGVHIKSIRDESNAKVNISEHNPGVHERVISVTGAIEEVAKAYAQVARGLNSADPRGSQSDSVEGTPLTLRYLIPNSRMGIVIGKGGARIKEIQDESNARLAAQPQALPHSHDRLLEMVGVPDAIHIATYHMLVTIKEHADRPLNDRPYRPEYGVAMHNSSGPPYNSSMSYHGMPNSAPYQSHYQHQPQHQYPQSNSMGTSHNYYTAGSQPTQETRTFYCPPNKVGNLIGKGGMKINRMRTECGCKITVEESRGEREDRPFTVTGPASGVHRAMAMLEQTLRRELQRDVQDSSAAGIGGNTGHAVPMQ